MLGAAFIALIAYVVVGYTLYRRRWPDGLFAREPDPDVARLRRIGRRRVLPLPERTEDEQNHNLFHQ